MAAGKGLAQELEPAMQQRAAERGAVPEQQAPGAACQVAALEPEQVAAGKGLAQELATQSRAAEREAVRVVEHPLVKAPIPVQNLEPDLFSEEQARREPEARAEAVLVDWVQVVLVAAQAHLVEPAGRTIREAGFLIGLRKTKTFWVFCGS